MSAGIQNAIYRIRKIALAAAVLGTAAALVGFFSAREDFYRTYLISFLFWWGISLGSLALIMIHHVAAGRWGFAVRRICEAAIRTLPVMIVLFLPIYLSRYNIYGWLGHSEGPHHEVVDAKRLYLNDGFFTVRAIGYFVIWLLMGRFLVGRSYRQDENGDPSINRGLARLSAPGLIVYMLTVTFASVDWAMSLEPEWFSSMYGILFVAGQALSVLAFSIILLTRLRREEPLAGILKPVYFHDLGNLMFAFTVFWAYITFSQYIIIWAGNLPEEIPWFMNRSGRGLVGVAVFLTVFHFAVPFLIMLSRLSKQRAHIIRVMAIWMFAVRFVDLYWIISPAFNPKSLHLHWLDFVMPFAVGGIWMTVFCTLLAKRPILPQHDPRFPLRQQEK
ncbi:MAG: hypothetical protein KJ626_00520 [Verrucomicrobia bacterium]|nr:hypothetical protein [Verrucomicrobiota bacterium]